MAKPRFWLKMAALAVVIGALGLGAALVALKALFPEPKARAYAVEAARRQLGREVRLERIDIGLTGLHLQGLALSERPDFGAGTFLSVGTFSLRPSWRALLRRKLVVISASADGLKLRVVKNADGSFNYDTLASSGAASAPAQAPAAPAERPDLDIRRLRVANGAVEYLDAATGASWAVSDLALKLDGFSLAEPFDLDASLRARGKAGDRPVDAVLAFAGTVDLARGARDKFKVEFKRLSVEQEGWKLTAKGKAAGLDATEASLEAALTASGKTLLRASGTLKASAPSAGGARAVDADLKLDTPGLDTALLAKWLPQAGVPAVTIPAGDAALTGRWDGDSATATAFRASWKGGTVSGSGSAKGLGTKAPVYEGRAKFGLDVPEIRAGEYAFLKLPPRSFIPAMRLDGEASYAAGDLALPALEAKFKQGTASASGAVRRLLSAKPVPDLALRFAVDLPSFQISDLPVAVSTALRPGFTVPAMRLDGGARARGDDLALEKVVIKGKSGTLKLDGLVAKALAGTPEPALEVVADLDLPALAEKDLPLSGAPPGLELPPSRWDADLSYTPRAIRLRKFGVKIASNQLSVEGGISDPAGRAAFDLIIKCPQFVLEELTRMTPQTRELKLTGSGKFGFAMVGTKEKPVFNGKFQFNDIGATVAELPLSGFSGTASVDPDSVNIPTMKGRVADGALTMHVRIEDYAKVPKIEVTAALDRFDLGKYLSAKKKVEADVQGRAAKAGRPVDGKSAAPIRTLGKVQIGSLIHPNAQLRDVTASWDLWGVTPDMKKLNGEATIGAGGGRLHALGDLALQSRVAKVLLYPFLIVQKLAIGVNLNDIDVLGIAGEYAFKDGLMTLRKSELDAGKIVQVSTVGTIDLPAEALNLIVSAQVGTLPGAEIKVTGTAADPKTKVNVGKILENAGKNLLDFLNKPR